MRFVMSSQREEEVNSPRLEAVIQVGHLPVLLPHKKSVADGSVKHLEAFSMLMLLHSAADVPVTSC